MCLGPRGYSYSLDYSTEDHHVLSLLGRKIKHTAQCVFAPTPMLVTDLTNTTSGFPNETEMCSFPLICPIGQSFAVFP